jgi:hypothetical protein
MSGQGDCDRSQRMRGQGVRIRDRRLLMLTSAMLMSAITLFVLTSSASALMLGMDWRNYDKGELDAVQRSGATVYHLALDYNGTSGGNWGTYDELVEAAWKRGITILPGLVRSGPSGNRFLLSTDSGWASWGAWVREAVERYGVNGSFWNGKANPTPISAWEVWNEPNLIENNPKVSKTVCQSFGQTYFEKEEACIQPQNYGKFLKYTSEQIQAGSYAKTAHGTDVLFGGLYMPAGENYNSFLSKAYGVSGVPGAFTGVAIHPYSFVTGGTGMVEEVNGIRTQLNTMGATEKTLWITELGWPTAGSAGFPTGGHPVSESEQASLLIESFNWIKAAVAGDKIALASWFNIRDYNSGSHWDGSCGLLKGDGTYKASWYAYQQEAGVEQTGTQYAAFQANNYELWYYPTTTGLGVPSKAGMDPGTSPSAVSMPRGGDLIAFQDWQHHLWTYSTDTGVAHNTELGIAEGTNPSVAYIPGNGYEIAFQDWGHHLWKYSTATGTAVNTEAGMLPGTSPSIVAKPDGSYAIAFQANNYELWYALSNGAFTATKVGMEPGTDPSIAAISSGGYVIAFQDWQHHLWKYSTATGTAVNTEAGMLPGTSPSIVAK